MTTDQRSDDAPQRDEISRIAEDIARDLFAAYPPALRLARGNASLDARTYATGVLSGLLYFTAHAIAMLETLVKEPAGSFGPAYTETIAAQLDAWLTEAHRRAEWRRHAN
jgi:hypothetical protein